MKKPRWVAILGPTASGKTSLAFDLALNFHGEIISADSVQVYRGMDIGRAKPTAEQKILVPHHLIDILSTFDTPGRIQESGGSKTFCRLHVAG